MRTAHLGMTGSVYSGPISHTWYQQLERIMSQAPFPWARSHCTTGIVVRAALDALLFSPVAVTGYFAIWSILEGKVPELHDKLSSKWQRAVVASWNFLARGQYHSFQCRTLAIPSLVRKFYGIVLKCLLKHS